jgi:hypothetical protein
MTDTSPTTPPPPAEDVAALYDELDDEAKERVAKRMERLARKSRKQ